MKEYHFAKTYDVEGKGLNRCSREYQGVMSNLGAGGGGRGVSVPCYSVWDCR